MKKLTFDQFLKGERPPEPSPKLKPDIPVTDDMRLWRVAGHVARDAVVHCDPEEYLLGWGAISANMGVSCSTARRYQQLLVCPWLPS
jgi:hypothetical protein